MNRTTLKLRMMSRRILLFVGLLFSSTAMQGYTVGSLDTTADGGTGYGDATPSSAPGYVTGGFGDAVFINGSVVQPDGKTVVVGGDSTGTPVAIVARYNINGTEDTTFNYLNPVSGFYVTFSVSGATSTIAHGVTVLPNGKIIVVGQATVSGNTKFFIAQFTSTGALDTTNFNSPTGYAVQNVTISSTSDIANAVAVNPAGYIYVVGTSVDTQTNIFVARYTSAGVLDTLYNPTNVVMGGGTPTTAAPDGFALICILNQVLAGNGIAIEPANNNQNVVVVGANTTGNAMLVARFTNEGIPDTTFNNSSGYNTLFLGTGSAAYGVGFQALSPNIRKIVISGTDGTNFAVARFTTAGLLDSYANDSSAPFGTGGATHQTGYNNSQFSGIGRGGIAIQADDSIVMSGQVTVGSATRFKIASFLANGSGLNPAFNPSAGFNDSAIPTNNANNVGNTLSLQQNGSFIVGGTYTDSHTNFATARYLGTIPQGCMDYTYNPAIATSPGTPGFRTYPTDTTPTNKPKVVAMYPFTGLSGDIYVLSQETSTCQVVQLDSTGATVGSAATINEPIGTDVIADSLNRAVAIGTTTTTPSGWIQRYIKNDLNQMVPDTAFNNGSVVTSTLARSFFRVGEQAAGRLIVVGIYAADTTKLIIIAYNEHGDIANSSQTLCAPFGSGGAGNQTGYIILPFPDSTRTTIQDMLIDSDDNIFILCSMSAIAKFLPDGSGLDRSYAINSSFGAGIANLQLSGTVQSGLMTFTSTPTSGSEIVVVYVGSDKLSYAQFHTDGSGGLSGGFLYSLLVPPFVVTKVQCDTSSRVLFTGYDKNDFFIGRFTSAFALNNTFAPYADFKGILKTMYNSNNPTNTSGLTAPYRFSNSVCINSNGAILFGGYENITNTSTVSLVGQIVGNTGGPADTQVPRFPGGPTITTGMLNIFYGTGGSFDLNTNPISLPAGQARAINSLTAGTYAGNVLLADSNGSSTTLAMVTPTETGATATTVFGGSGTINLPNMAQATAILVDPTGLNYYVLGQLPSGLGSYPIVYAVTPTTTTGTLGAPFATPNFTGAAYAIAQQASGRILVAGWHNLYGGVIVAYTPAGAIDTSFNPGGVNGVHATPGYLYLGGSTGAITSLSIGTGHYADRIYISYNDGANNAVINMVLENGTGYAPATGTGSFTPITNGFNGNVVSNQIRMQIDYLGNIVLVANTDSSAGIQAAYYPTNGGTAITAPFTVIPSSDSATLENVLSLTDSTTLILGSNPESTPSTSFMNLVRVVVDSGALVLDPTFNAGSTPTGLLTTTVPSPSALMEDFYALDVVAAGGILVVGDNSPTASTAAPYLAAVYSTVTPTKVSQSATSFGAAGTLDTTFNAAGTNAGFMNIRTEVVSGFPATTSAKVLLQLPNGIAYYVAGSTASDTYVMQMSDDDVQVPGWASGLLTISGKANVSGMLYAQNGGLVIVGGAGSSGSHAGWAAQYSAADGALYTDFVPTTFLDAHYAVAQQSNGRILVAGINAGVGAIIAYNSVTGAVDTTFGVNGIYTATGYTAINSILVDASDTIYFMANDGSNNAKVVKIVVGGTDAAPGWTIPTVSATSTISANNHLAFNQVGNILATAVNTTTNVVAVRLYIPSDGSLSASLGLAATTGSGNFATGIVTPNVTSIMVDLNASPGKVILTGYDSSTSPATPFIIRTNTTISTGPDTSFNSAGANPGTQTYHILISGVTTNWYAGMINADGKITVAGYASGLTTPYLMRVYGDEFIGQYLPQVSAGVPGTIDTNFATSGYLSLINGSIPTTAIPQVVLPASNGAQYVAFASGDTHSASIIARYTNANILDNLYHSTGIAVNSPAGLYSMSFLANGGLLVAGTSSFDAIGWVEQYTTAGILDPTFNPSPAAGSAVTPYVSATPGILAIPSCTKATVAVQQSLSRIVVAGQKSGGNGAVFGITNTGAVDATFGTAGIYDTGIATTIYAMVADQYDRLIIAYKNGATIDLRRLTSSGELDTTFGVGGTISSAITGTSDMLAQVRVTLDLAGNIVIAAHISNPAIAIRAYNNTIGTSPAYAQLNISSLTVPTLTGLIATTDGKVLVSGNQSGSNDMWVARLTSSGGLDIAFAPSIGIMQFAPGAAATPTARNLTSIAIYGDGEISMVGTETSSTATTNNPFMSRAYNTPYTSQEPIDLTASAPGTNDATFGVTTHVANGITFFATIGSVDTSCNQVARAVVMQNGNDNGVVVALDGKAQTNSSGSSIFINMFDVDGLLNTSFKPSTVDNTAPGQLLVLSMFNNQYVNDMLTFTVGGVSKAILAGYATNTTPSATGSLLMQCVLTASAPGLDSSFGGFNGNSLGVAFGDGQLLNTVGLQSNSRIIAAGLDQSGNGLLLGYTAAGNLDQSFGQGGTFVQGTTGIYTSAIDSQDRLVIAYRVGSTVTLARILADGSGLDTTFNSPNGFLTTTITTAISNSNLRLAIDGNNNIAVAAVVTDTAAGTCFKIARYTFAGVLSGTVNLIGTGGSAMGLTAFTITKLLVDTNGAVVVVGYDNAASDQVVVARLVYSSGQYDLDPTFNPTPGTPGYIKYEVNNEINQQTVGAFIHPDGRIIVAGSQH